MPFRKVEEYVQCFYNTGDLTIQEEPKFLYGKKLIDSFGDFIIFFYDPDKNQVMYCFKGAEAYWFPCKIMYGNQKG